MEETALTPFGAPAPRPQFRHIRRLVELRDKAFQTAGKIHDRYKKFEEKHERGVERTYQFVEIVAGSAVGGVIQGKTADKKLFNAVPYDLAIGAAGIAVGVFGGKTIGQEASWHVFNAGTGVAAAWAANLGHKIGTKWKDQGHLFGSQEPPPPTASAGVPSAGRMASLLSNLPGAQHR